MIRSYAFIAASCALGFAVRPLPALISWTIIVLWFGFGWWLIFRKGILR